MKSQNSEALEAQNRSVYRLTMVAWRLKIEPWRAYRPELLDSCHFDGEQDTDPHKSEKLDLDPH
jgi:hypothetical protein